MLGAPLQGRLTSTSANGSYSLQIKNFDFTMTSGLNTTMNQGEAVSSTDFGWLSNHYGHTAADHPLDWWADFDSDGVIGPSEWAMMTNHVTHDCDTPYNQ